MYVAFKTEVGAQMVIQARFAMTGLRDLVAESTSDVTVSLWRCESSPTDIYRWESSRLEMGEFRVRIYRCESWRGTEQ